MSDIAEHIEEPDKKWCIYLLEAQNNSYVGATTNPLRRLRQHNRELVGGAKCTRRRAGAWKLFGYISGFEDRASAYRWEALLKKRAKNLKARKVALLGIAEKKCPQYRNRPLYDVPDGLVLTLEEHIISSDIEENS